MIQLCVSISIQAISYFIVSFAMYLVAQISPFEWKKASVCNHYDEDDDDKMNDNEFHHHSSNSLNCEEDDFMTNRETSITTMRIEENTMELLEGEEKEKRKSKGQDENEGVVEKEVGDGNCCENYNTSTLQKHQQYFKNMCLMNEQNDLESIWINLESRRNFFIERQRQQQQQIGSSKHHSDSHENLDIDDDGLIGYADIASKHVHDEGEVRELDEDAQDFTSFNNESQNIELISYINNFSLKNSFAWTLGTLLQSTTDLVPKV